MVQRRTAQFGSKFCIAGLLSVFLDMRHADGHNQMAMLTFDIHSWHMVLECLSLKNQCGHL